jgi:hypothetical protein
VARDLLAALARSAVDEALDLGEVRRFQHAAAEDHAMGSLGLPMALHAHGR